MYCMAVLLHAGLYDGSTKDRASQVALLVMNLPTSVGDPVSVPGVGRSPGGGHGNPLQYSSLGNSMDRGAWWAIVHALAKYQA